MFSRTHKLTFPWFLLFLSNSISLKQDFVCSGMSHVVHLPVVCHHWPKGFLKSLWNLCSLCSSHLFNLSRHSLFLCNWLKKNKWTLSSVGIIQFTNFTLYFLKIYFNIILWSVVPGFSEVNCPSHKNPLLYLILILIILGTTTDSHKVSFNIVLCPQLCYRLPSCVFPWNCPTKISYAFCVS